MSRLLTSTDLLEPGCTVRVGNRYGKVISSELKGSKTVHTIHFTHKLVAAHTNYPDFYPAPKLYLVEIVPKTEVVKYFAIMVE